MSTGLEGYVCLTHYMNRETSLERNEAKERGTSRHVRLLSQRTLCDRMDCSPPGSSVHGILQARVLEWDAIAFSMRHNNQIHLTSRTGQAATNHNEHSNQSE